MNAKKAIKLAFVAHTPIHAMYFESQLPVLFVDPDENMHLVCYQGQMVDADAADNNQRVCAF